MNDGPRLLIALVAGGLIGAVFYGGLWWTVARGVSSKRPATWFLTSLMVRMAIAILGFYAVSNGSWMRLVACLLGFVVARVIVTQLAGAPPKAAIGSTKEGCP